MRVRNWSCCCFITTIKPGSTMLTLLGNGKYLFAALRAFLRFLAHICSVLYAPSTPQKGWFIHTRKGWSFISAHPLLRCLEKPLKRMKRIRPPHPCADIQKAQFGAAPKDDQTPRKGISYLYPLFLFLLVVFQTSSMKRIKRNMPILTNWLFSVFIQSLQSAMQR